MKKITRLLALPIACAAIFAAATFSGCGEKNITVVSRESGSGTRSAFDELINDGTGNTLTKTADGTKRDGVTKKALIFNATGDVKTKVAQVKTAIGYISYGSLDESVKALTIENIAPSPQTVQNGSYKLQRPFVILNNANTQATQAAEDFLKYLKSDKAATIAEENKYVPISESQSYTAPISPLSGTIIIKGSTSVEPLMAKLIADYRLIGGLTVKNIEFTMDAQGSASGLTAVKNDNAGNVIGMSSADIIASEKDNFDYFVIARDAIAVIVNNANTLTNISVSDLYFVYTGSIVRFSELGK